MHPILEKTLFRMLMFHAYGLFVAWIFTFIEKRAESSHERMERILQELKNEVDTNYNMTNNDFARFVAKAAEAVMEGNQLDWNFLNSCGFTYIHTYIHTFIVTPNLGFSVTMSKNIYKLKREKGII